MAETLAHRFTEFLLESNALKFGDFRLTSGKKASYYLDGKQVTLDAHGARATFFCIAERARAHVIRTHAVTCRTSTIGR